MLRPYQKEALDAIKKAFQSGVKRGLLVLPTGSGKTVIMANLPHVMNLQPGEKMMILVHRDELVRQTVDKLHKYAPHLIIGVEKAEEEAPPAADIIVASVQTIGRNKHLGHNTFDFSKRIQKFHPEQFRYICIDEAHHAVANSYRSVLAYFKALKGQQDQRNDVFLLGVTATPNRADNIGLGNIFDKIVYNLPITKMIEDGWLTDIKAYRVQTNIPLDGVKIVSGDFAVGELERTVNTPERNRIIVDKYKELGENMPAIAFTVDVQHSCDLAEAFCAAGIPAAAIHGAMPLRERREKLEQFSRGELRLLASCGVLTEGFDEPSAAVGIMARPTRSGLLYRQQVGRVLRPYPAPEERHTHTGWVKPYAIIIDVCDVTTKHTLITAPQMLGFHSNMDFKGGTAKQAIRIMRQAEAKLGFTPPSSMFSNIQELQAISQTVSIFTPPEADQEIAKISKFNWIRINDDSFVLNLPNYKCLNVNVNTLGHWEVSRSVKGFRTVLSSHHSLEEAIRFADSQVPPEEKIIASRDSKWRNKPASEAQLKLIWKIDHKTRKMFPNLDDFLKAGRMIYQNCGAASDKINQLLGRL